MRYYKYKPEQTEGNPALSEFYQVGVKKVL